MCLEDGKTRSHPHPRSVPRHYPHPRIQHCLECEFQNLQNYLGKNNDIFRA